MNPRSSLSGLDSAFLSLETPSTPMNVVGTLVLDASSPGGGGCYERVLRLVEERAPRLAPLRRRMLAMPLGLDHPPHGNPGPGADDLGDLVRADFLA